MNPAALPRGTQHLADGVLEPFVGIGDHQLDPAQAALEQTPEEARPERLRLGGSKAQAHDLPLALGARRHRDYGGD